MSNRLPISGEYPPNWDAIGDRVREEAGHRCIRCGHPFKTGEHGKGEWTECDAGCTHRGPFGVLWVTPFSTGDEAKVRSVPDADADVCRKKGFQIFAQWRILTVHHLTGQKNVCEWWNLLAVCQRCHLIIQGRVNPDQPYMFEHSEWFKPYVAGFYAMKYLNQTLTRGEVMQRLDELLALERLA